MLRLERYTQKLRQEWDGFLPETKNAVFLFQREYMEYHADRFIDHSLLVYKEQRLIAVFPANEQGKTVYSHGGLTFGGLIVLKAIRAEEVLSMFDMLISYFAAREFETLFYKTVPHIFCSYPAEEDIYALFLKNATLTQRNIASIVDLKNPIRFSETKRQMVSKCTKLDVKIAETEKYDEFWSLLNEVLRKFDTAPVHSLSEIQFLHSRFPAKIRLFEARLQEELLAGIVIFDYDKVVHTQYMANSDKGRKLGVLDFINHYLLTQIFQDRSYYSYGTSNEQGGRFLNKGLILQKEMMGGRGIAYDMYQIKLNPALAQEL